MIATKTKLQDKKKSQETTTLSYKLEFKTVLILG